MSAAGKSEGDWDGECDVECFSIDQVCRRNKIWLMPAIDFTNQFLIAMPGLADGTFSGAVGLFHGHDQHHGVPVLVEFRWDKTNPEAPTWQQSFSADDGNTWELNWYMYFSRLAADN